MVKFVFEDSASTMERLAEWIQQDPYHLDSIAENWTNGAAIVACWVYDDKGPVMFLRAEAEGELVRLHLQFGPAAEVRKLRQIRAILEGWPRFVDTVALPSVKGIVFQSTSPTLVNFMKRLGFQDWKRNEYLLVLRKEDAV